MTIIPLTIEQAMDYLKANERHYKSESKPLFAIGISNGSICGAVVMGVTGEDAEIAHIYSAGEYQGYTTLYGSAIRAVKALGYKRLIL